MLLDLARLVADVFATNAFIAMTASRSWMGKARSVVKGGHAIYRAAVRI